MKVTESNCWILLDPEVGKTVSWFTWKYVNFWNSCWPHDQNCRQLYCSIFWGFTEQLLSSHKLPSAGFESMLACKLLICPSKLMQSNLLWSSPFHYPFSFSVVLVQSHGASLFCWAILSCMNLFYVCPSEKSLRGWNDIVHKYLCPRPSTVQVKCVTIACVAVMSSVAECESLPKHTVMSYICPDLSQSL